MPSINRIRVNNVKYNFGSQFYDDFTMRMHGKNTLYDLANGGGKSVLMLLLLQNMIPNCTLDEKQPIEKLFRTGNNNTTIHSLIEWKIDPADSKEGYRYMTTGFCARKAKDAEDGTDAGKDVASIEYFNYCIFYREFNKNDIINLPLVKDGERVSFQGLRGYLKDLEHRDMSLSVKVFDRKGEYQRFISGFGLHESQWEIIRGINKTEGHVRTYFENNYKTTRKVVEDLLIEEIIEKAFMVKTERDDSGQDSMAKMLMDIKEQLTVLAKKKKDIAAYDHQIELVSVLADKVASFMDLYEEQSKLSKLIADICVTGEQFAKNDEAKLEELKNKADGKRLQKNKQRERIECLKVSRDRRQLEELAKEEASLQFKIKEYQVRLEELQADLNFKESVNEYLEYIEDRNKYQQYDAIVKNMMAGSKFDERLLYTYVYNIKTRTDVMLTDIRNQMALIESFITEKKLSKEYQLKMLHEARVSHAVAVSGKNQADQEIVTLSEKLSNIRMSMSDIRFTDVDQQLEEISRGKDMILSKIKDRDNLIKEQKNIVNDTLLQISILESKINDNSILIDKISAKEQEYLEAKEKLDNISAVYGSRDIEGLIHTISGRITQAVLDKGELTQKLSLSSKRVERLKEGRLIDISKGAAKVLEYIDSRHGVRAMYGMDYLSALSEEQQMAILSVNPEFPYGVVCSEYDTIKDDPNIRDVDTGDISVNIYDMDMVEDMALHFGDNAFAIRKSPEYFTDKETEAKLIEKELMSAEELKQQLEIKDEMLEAYRQDQEFVLKISDGELLAAGEKLEQAKMAREKLEKDIAALRESLKTARGIIAKEEASAEEDEVAYQNYVSDESKIFTIQQLDHLIKEQEELLEKHRSDMARLDDSIRELSSQESTEDKIISEEEAKLKSLEKKIFDLENEWNNNYKSYYNPDEDYDILNYDDQELRARFYSMLSVGSEDAKTIEDKRTLMDTLAVAMDRNLKNIEKRGVSIDKLKDYEFRELLYVSDDEVISSCNRAIDEVKTQIKEYESRHKKKVSEIDRLQGSIDYAIRNIEDAFGAYVEEEASLSDIIVTLENGEALLKRLEQEANACDEEYRIYTKQQGYMIDLYKDVKRIVTTNDISLEGATPIYEEKDKLRDIFEVNLLKYDKSNKSLDRAKNELMKFKGNTASALDQMEVYELAGTIRDDVIIPGDYDEASGLMDNLKTIVEYIRLEKDRVSKSLVDMETIKANFEEQCLQRCLDVKTELDKLPKLSRIIADGEAIQMVGLTVPYVKEDFLKQRMSDYIDKIVAQADDYDSDKDRIKFIRNSLALKKLFGVIVTDMNAIKLSLYKRERIKEQSRYLKYEEAVGSTGQSQGIYIQFLVSIINYISGMYQTGNEDTRTKTIFIDNPFGAAKDVYIWEPIFALLAANNVQLIVPARGATPAITGRFDVNYILGQQMSGGKQLTVVVDYTSKVDQEELEYQDLEYEQVSFDFI
ncbi:MAG: hypothetical protein E7258_02765 [Lachnospiraceae bacterium]|nr:hypothetical protein [Lachnospiraceae bacterium]